MAKTQGGKNYKAYTLLKRKNQSSIPSGNAKFYFIGAHMKPKFTETLGELISYYYPDYHEYNFKLYICDKLFYDGSLECFKGYDYLNVVEFYRDSNNKALTVYTNMTSYLYNAN